MNKLKINKFKILFWILLYLSGITLCSCDNGSTDSPYGENCYILVLYPKAGLGDNGFLDNIYRAFKKNETDFSFALENIAPNSDSMAINAIDRFFNDSLSTIYEHRLLVLVGDYYEPLLKEHPDWHQKDNNSILLLDSDNDSFDTYVRGISLYGASFQAGALVKDMKYNNPAIYAANQTSIEVKRSIDGFIDGYQHAGGKFDMDNLIYIVDPQDSLDEGFGSSDDVYIMSHLSVFDENDFVFPIAGGSNAGLYRYIRESSNSVPFLTNGIDTDQHNQSDKIVFSIEKHMEKIVNNFVQKWIDGKKLAKKEFYTLESDYINLIFHTGYDEWEKHADKFKEKAIEAERKYLEGK